MNNLAALYYAEGRYVEAEPLYQRALEVFKNTLGSNHLLTARALNNLAELYRLQGRYDEAERFFQRTLAIKMTEENPTSPDTARSLKNLAALYYLQGRYEEAESLFRQALGIFEEISGFDHPNTANMMNSLARIEQVQGRYIEAENLFQHALEIFKATSGPEHPSTANILNNLALLYQEQGLYSEAEDLHYQALAIHEKNLGFNHPLTAITSNNLAILHWSQNQIQSALSYLKQGIITEEAVLSRNLLGGSDANKRDYLSTVAGTTNIMISLHLNAMTTDPEATQLAFNTILQRKGRILDFFTNLRNQLASDSTAIELLNSLNAANTQLSNLTSDPSFSISTESYKTQLQALQSRMMSLEDQLSRRSTDFTNLKLSPSLAEIQAALPESTALAEFISYQPFIPNVSWQERFGETRYAVYILKSNGTIQGMDLGPAEAIDKAIDTLSDSLASPDTPRVQVKEDAQTLDALIMAPVRQALGDTTTVFLSPDDALNLVPFESLVDESGNYLVETYQFRYLTSGRDLMRVGNTVPSSNPAILVGNPTYDRPGALVTQANTRAVDFKNRIFPSLPGTQAEVALIAAKLDDAIVYTETNATEAVLKQQAQPSILHLANHGFFEPTEENLNPLLQSGLILAGAAYSVQSDPEQDGILTALEVTGMNLSGTQLVVLSACETGLGELAAGEGVYGLRRALVLAGTQSQAISLWKVDDIATQKLMVDYYDHLLSGSPRDAALRKTQLAFLKSDEYSHPYYWAAFIGSGDWRPLK